MRNDAHIRNVSFGDGLESAWDIWWPSYSSPVGFNQDEDAKKMLVHRFIARISCILLILLALPAATVVAACFPPPAGMLGWWPGDGDATDLVHTNNGTLHGGAT